MHAARVYRDRAGARSGDLARSAVAPSRESDAFRVMDQRPRHLLLTLNDVIGPGWLLGRAPPRDAHSVVSPVTVRVEDTTNAARFATQEIELP